MVVLNSPCSSVMAIGRSICELFLMVEVQNGLKEHEAIMNSTLSVTRHRNFLSAVKEGGRPRICE